MLKYFISVLLEEMNPFFFFVDAVQSSDFSIRLIHWPAGEILDALDHLHSPNLES